MQKKPLKFLYDLVTQISRIPGLGWTSRPLKLVIYTLEGLMAHGTMDMSATLTFYTLISLVPVVALAFAVVKGFGLAESLIGNLYSLLPQMPEVVDYIVTFANNTLARTSGGVVAAISVVTLLWSVVRVFDSIEANFNKIWEVKSTRNLVRKYTDYITVVIIAPLLWIVATSVSAYARNFFGFDDSWWMVLLSKLLSMVFVWAMFTFIYLVIPNTKVRLRSALLASVFAGTGFFLFQALFVYLMKWMTSYSAIYGSFAALPLFLLWMQNSWSILLLGCELSFAIQNEKRYDEERELPSLSHDCSEKLLLAIVSVVARHYLKGEGAVAVAVIREELAIPSRIASKLVGWLVEAGILHEVRCETKEWDVAYAPARDVTTMRVCDVLEAVNGCVDEGEVRDEELYEARLTKRTIAVMERLHLQMAQSAENKLITELIKDE